MCTNHANTCLHSFCNIKPHDAIWSKCTPFQTHPNPSKLSSQVAWRSWTSGRPLRKRSATKIEQPQLQAKLQIGSTMTRTWKSNLVELRSQPVPSAWTKDPYWSSSLCVQGPAQWKISHPGSSRIIQGFVRIPTPYTSYTKTTNRSTTRSLVSSGEVYLLMSRKVLSDQ